MSLLILAMNKPRLLGKVQAAKSADWLGWKAHVLVSSLIKKFKPIDTIAIAEQTMKLMVLKLRRQEDSEELGDMISELETQYSSSIEEKQKIAAIVNSIGTQYESVI